MEVVRVEADNLKNNFTFFNSEYLPQKNKNFSADLQEAIRDSRERKNLHGPFDSAEKAVASILED